MEGRRHPKGGGTDLDMIAGSRRRRAGNHGVAYQGKGDRLDLRLRSKARKSGSSKFHSRLCRSRA